MQVNIRDIGKHLEGAIGYGHIQHVAGGTGDGTMEHGTIIDMQALENFPVSVAAHVMLSACAVAKTKTLSLSTRIMHGDDSGLSDEVVYTYDGAADDQGVVQDATAAAITDGDFELVRSINLTGVKRYWRLEIQTTFTNTTTDTAEVTGTLLLFSGEAPAADST